MDNITYRQATDNDFNKCLDVIYDAFQDYSVYHIWEVGSTEKQNKFNRAAMSVQLYDAMKNDTVMVAERNNEIICVSLIQDENHKEPSILTYAFYGGLSILRYGGIKNTFGLLNMMDTCNSHRLKYAETNPCFNLECIAVSKKFIGKGIGSHMIQDCIIPFVKKHGGKHITLITNALNNTFFYKKNGFEIIEHDTSSYNNKSLENWTFKLDIQ